MAIGNSSTLDTRAAPDTVSPLSVKFSLGSWQKKPALCEGMTPNSYNPITANTGRKGIIAFLIFCIPCKFVTKLIKSGHLFFLINVTDTGKYRLR